MKPFVWMRNVLLSALPVCLLTGCTGATAESDFQPSLDPSFTVTAEMDYSDAQQASFSLTRYSDGVWDATFSEPASLAGVVLTFDGSAVSASYKGLAFTVPKSAMGAKTMLLYVTDVLDTFEGAEAPPCTQAEDGRWSAAGDCEGGSYTVTFSADGTLAGFTLPSQPLTLTFSGYICNSSDAAPGTDTDEAPDTKAPEETTAPCETTVPSGGNAEQNVT